MTEAANQAAQAETMKELLMQAWKEVLKADEVSDDSDFF